MSLKNIIAQKEQGDDIRTLMAEALKSDQGMRALAAVIANPITTEYDAVNFTSELLTEVSLPPGEAAKFQKRKGIQAHWIDFSGEVMSCPVDRDEVEFSVRRIASAPEIEISMLENGNVGSLTDMEIESGRAIANLVDVKTLELISAAVPAANIVSISGGVLTQEALNAAYALMWDNANESLDVGTLVMRGSRFNELDRTQWSEVAKEELRQKGFLAVKDGAKVLITSKCAANEVLILPTVEIGKFAVRKSITVEADKQIRRFKVGFVNYMEAAAGITAADRIVKIVIED